MSRFTEGVGALLAVAALVIIGYLAIVGGSEQAEGAIIALLSAAVGWLYRGRLQAPDTGEVTLTAAPPATASITTQPRPPKAPDPGRD